MYFGIKCILVLHLIYAIQRFFIPLMPSDNKRPKYASKELKKWKG